MTVVAANVPGFFSMEGLPWIILAWSFIYILRPITSVIHELGHALAAFLFTDQPIQIRVGAGEGRFHFRVNRIEVFFASKQMITGYTVFSALNLSKLKLLGILLAGPFFSAFAAALGILLIHQTNFHLAIDAVMIGWVCSHLLCFIRNMIPIHLQNPHSNGKTGIPSDGLQIFRIFR